MMYYGGGHMTGWGWFGMTIGMIAFWGLLIALGVLLFRSFSAKDTTPNESQSGPTAPDPRQILAERYARGEIDEDEYQQRLATLGGAGTPPRQSALH